MRQWNNGQIEEELQIRFTAYLIAAIKRKRKDYMNKQERYHKKELPIDEICAVVPDLENQVMDLLPLMDSIGSRALWFALKQLSDRERYVFLGRVLDGYPFEVLGSQLGLSYKGTAAIYYRALKKIKKNWGEVRNYDF